MTHIVHPYAHRLGITKDWRSRWFGVKSSYRQFLESDILAREYLEKRLRGFYLSGVEMERGAKSFRVVIKTSRPGLLIGKSGEGALRLKSDLARFLRKKRLPGSEELRVDIEEVRSPESNAAIVVSMVAEGLEKRLPFRRVMKQTLEKVMANRDVRGVKMYLGGRLGGAEMARSEELKRGRIPLQTFRADIDFARGKAHLPYGDIGIKVWIYKGDIFAGKKPAKR